MKREEHEVCANCRFFFKDGCRRRPPIRLPRRFSSEATSGNRIREEDLLWGWPQVSPTDWCGEYVNYLA